MQKVSDPMNVSRRSLSHSSRAENAATEACLAVYIEVIFQIIAQQAFYILHYVVFYLFIVASYRVVWSRVLALVQKL